MRMLRRRRAGFPGQLLTIQCGGGFDSKRISPCRHIPGATALSTLRARP